jgi:hypothetical protein
VQWRARFVGGTGSARISDVTVAYANYNRPPEGRDFALSATERSVSGLAVFHCTVSDPDHDPVEVTLEYRPAATDGWLEVDNGDEPRDEPRDEPLRLIEGPRKKELKWNTDEVPEGAYVVRAVASDQPANHPGEGHRVRLEPLNLVVDRTAPEMEIRSTGGGVVDVVLSDAHSEIRLLQVMEKTGRALAAIRPDDGVCDSRRETFRIERPAEEADWILVGVDAAGNTVEQPLQ